MLRSVHVDGEKREFSTVAGWSKKSTRYRIGMWRCCRERGGQLTAFVLMFVLTLAESRQEQTPASCQPCTSLQQRGANPPRLNIAQTPIRFAWLRICNTVLEQNICVVPGCLVRRAISQPVVLYEGWLQTADNHHSLFVGLHKRRISSLSAASKLETGNMLGFIVP
jgi:hypothetical protein